MTISIKELSFKTIIGLLEFERTTPQKVIVRAHIDYVYKNKDSFIDYALLVQLIETTMHKEKFELIETSLNELFNLISLKYSSIQRLFIKISKPDILPNCRVSVSKVKIY